MNRNIKLFFLVFWLSIEAAAQNLLQSGPMVGYSAMREVSIWVQTNSSAKVKIAYWNPNNAKKKFFTDEATTKKESGFTAKLIADNLEPGQSYYYELYINGKKVKRDYELKFKTQKLWQWREDPPAIKFAAGSCAYVNETVYDRPGEPYGNNYEVFTSIYNHKPEFMLWLGDNSYLREVDWDSWSGILKRFTHTRSLPELQPIFGSVHNYAIWDDHDFGPNDSDRGFWNKEKTFEAFKLFWPNPSFGINGKPGITTFFQWGDVDFFLLDDRYYKSPNYRKTGERTILGAEQIEWLIDNLSYSRAPFKIIAVGGQFLNPNPGGENFSTYPEERQKILDLIHQNNIEGVIFLTGDVHRTELTKMIRDNAYPLYDITTSPMTAGPSKVYPNDWRVDGTVFTQRNYSIFEVTGPRKDRTLKCTVYDTNGKELWKVIINEKELKYKD
ncbi:MAG: alkaline phosphatase D family protein [Bacteroidota bacterium]